MELSKNTIKIIIVSFFILILGTAGYISYTNYSHKKEITALRNVISQSQETITIKDGLYSKLSVETENIKGLIESKEKEIQSLLKEIKDRKEEILSANSLVIRWKKAYEGAANAKEYIIEEKIKEVPGKEVVKEVPGKEVVKEIFVENNKRVKVEFDKDFGYISASGYTITNPPEAWVKVKQNRPLKLTLAITQDKDKKWKSYVTSSEENIPVDISLSSVNPLLLEKKWYEKIEVNTNFAIGSSVYTGIGIGYQIGSFSIGPSFNVMLNEKVEKFYGVNFTWRPFQKK